jgi:FkbM family methyltransferase
MVRDIRLATGQWLRVDLRDWCGALFLSPNAIEPVTTKFLQASLRPGDVFVDVGGNVGYYAVLAGGWVGRGGRVLCCEPNPVLAEMLTTSVQLNGLEGVVTPVRLAIANVACQGQLFYMSTEPRNTGLSSLTPYPGHLQSGALSPSHVIKVETTTLTELVRSHGLTRLDAVKIDVEGAEEQVWAGAEEAIRQFRPRFIICESHLGGPVSERARVLGYNVDMLEPLNQEGTWGNVLFRDKS